MFIDNIYPVFIGGLVTFVVCALIIWTQGWHGRWTHDSHEGVQKIHVYPTPRIGGIAILVGMWVVISISEENLKTFSIPFLIAGTVPFGLGLAEDITKSISAHTRLFSSMAGALAVVFTTDVYLNRVDIPYLDILMTWWPIGILLTVIAISGLTNAVNILDGFNGLSAGTVLIILSIFSVAAHDLHDHILLGFCLITIGVVIGFIILNYPLGQIFLGDGGAYFLGFLVGWVAILLPVRHEIVSPWFSLLVCFYPVTEVLYSMLRRVLNQQRTVQPDSCHLHSLIKKRLVSPYLSFLPSWGRNAAVAPSIWLCTLLTGWLAYCFIDKKTFLVGIFFSFLLCYHIAYQFLLKAPKR